MTVRFCNALFKGNGIRDECWVMSLGGHRFSLQARNEPDVYETSDLPEDDQAEFDAVRLCATSGSLWTLTFLPRCRSFSFSGKPQQ
jgi:hypothetical protein